MQKMPFEDNSFDGIWSVSSILHILKLHIPKKDVINVLKEFNRILKPKGIVYFLLHKGNFEGFRKKDSYKGYSRYFTDYLEGEFANYLEKSGFKLLESFNKDLKSNKSGITHTWINVFAIKN